jgi:hypothetical protein
VKPNCRIHGNGLGIDFDDLGGLGSDGEVKAILEAADEVQ